MKIKDKVVVITGANRGIGEALALELDALGAQLILTARSLESIDQSKYQNIKEIIELDLLDKPSIDSFIKRMESEEIDILINNAGLLTGGLLEEQPIEDIYKMYQVNLVGLTHIIHGVLPSMIKRGKGLIINNASVSGIMHLPCATTYAAAKSGVVALSNSLRAELKNTGVKVLTLVTPGIQTRMYEKIDELYGKNMDLSAMSSIPPTEYAKRVIKSIEKESDFYWPGGGVRFMLFLSRFAPKIFYKIVGTTFKRS